MEFFPAFLMLAFTKIKGKILEFPLEAKTSTCSLQNAMSES